MGMTKVFAPSQIELMDKVAALEPLPAEQRNSVVCALLGHSKIVTMLR